MFLSCCADTLCPASSAILVTDSYSGSRMPSLHNGQVVLQLIQVCSRCNRNFNWLFVWPLHFAALLLSIVFYPAVEPPPSFVCFIFACASHSFYFQKQNRKWREQQRRKMHPNQKTKKILNNAPFQALDDKKKQYKKAR